MPCKQTSWFSLSWHAVAMQDAANGLNGYKMGDKTLVVKMAGSRGPPPGQGCALSHLLTDPRCLPLHACIL